MTIDVIMIFVNRRLLTPINVNFGMTLPILYIQLQCMFGLKTHMSYLIEEVCFESFVVFNVSYCHKLKRYSLIKYTETVMVTLTVMVKVALTVMVTITVTVTVTVTVTLTVR